MDEAQRPREDPEVTRMDLAKGQREPALSRAKVPEGNRVEAGWPQERP